MSRRTFAPNAVQPQLASLITGGSATIALDSVAGLDATGLGGYMVIDPDDITKREFFKWTTLNGNTLEGLTRGLIGSAAGAIGHDAGAPVRQVFASQALDDIHLDIIDLEADVVTLTAVDVDHAAASDPHPGYLTPTEGDIVYVKLVGSTMTGPLVLDADPSAALGASTKQYTDQAEADAINTAATASEEYADNKDHDHDQAILDTLEIHSDGGTYYDQTLTVIGQGGTDGILSQFDVPMPAGWNSAIVSVLVTGEVRIGNATGSVHIEIDGDPSEPMYGGTGAGIESMFFAVAYTYTTIGAGTIDIDLVGNFDGLGNTTGGRASFMYQLQRAS